MEIVKGLCERDPQAERGLGSWYWWLCVVETDTLAVSHELADGYAAGREAGLAACDTAAHGLGYVRCGGRGGEDGHEYRKGTAVQSGQPQEDEEDEGCPVDDPSCEGRAEDCHDACEARTDVERCRDTLSDLLEDPDAGNDPIRSAAVALLLALNLEDTIAP